MKIFIFKNRRDLGAYTLSEMKKALATGVPSVQEDTLYFGRLNDLMRAASTARFELFQSILEKKPRSLYELAQLTNKDQAYVLREARGLESIGLIRLLAVKEGGREKLRPEALYDKIVIDVEFKQEGVSPPTPEEKEVA